MGYSMLKLKSIRNYIPSGKSRTVIGVEVHVPRSLTLLVLDPILPHEQVSIAGNIHTS